MVCCRRVKFCNFFGSFLLLACFGIIKRERGNLKGSFGISFIILGGIFCHKTSCNFTLHWRKIFFVPRRKKWIFLDFPRFLNKNWLKSGHLLSWVMKLYKNIWLIAWNHYLVRISTLKLRKFVFYLELLLKMV